MVTPNTVLTDNVNGTFITYNGNEFCLQNNAGNKLVAKLTEGYIPIGIKEHNGILYIVSVKKDEDDSWITEIGSYKSPDWTREKEEIHDLNDAYAPLKNYSSSITRTKYSFIVPNFFPKPVVLIDEQEPSEVCEICLTAPSASPGYFTVCPTCGNVVSWLDDTNLQNALTSALAGNIGDKPFVEGAEYFFNTLSEAQAAIERIKSVLNTYFLFDGSQDTVYGYKYEFTPVTSNPESVGVCDFDTAIRESSETEYGVETNFRTKVFGFNPQHPVSIEIQDSYDGSVNLILTDNQNPIRIVNTAFSVLPNEQCKLIDRNESAGQPTNIYSDDTIDTLTKLVQNPISFAFFELESVTFGGQLKGGNYTFYAKYGDTDGNETDICAESGIVSIFKGDVEDPSTISGTLAEERTDKLVNLTLHNINEGYSKIYIYAVREYSDTQGFRMTEAFKFEKPFDVVTYTDELSGTTEKQARITITGLENTTSINIEDLNISYIPVESVKTFTQQQDMLFLGNVTRSKYNYEQLDSLAKTVKMRLCRKNDSASTTYDEDSLAWVPYNYSSSGEYYDVHNIYSKVGYYPGEYYRFGIVFMLADGSMTNVYNMYGGDFGDFLDRDWYTATSWISSSSRNYNPYGVVHLPLEKNYNHEGVPFSSKIIRRGDIVPWHINFNTEDLYAAVQADENLKNTIKGFVIVRQKRIPEVITQGLQIGVEKNSHVPSIYISDENDTTVGYYNVESFVRKSTTQSGYKNVLEYVPQGVDGEAIDSSATTYNVLVHVKLYYKYRTGTGTSVQYSNYYALLSYYKQNGSFYAIQYISRSFPSDVLSYEINLKKGVSQDAQIISVENFNSLGIFRNKQDYLSTIEDHIIYSGSGSTSDKTLYQYLIDNYGTSDPKWSSETISDGRNLRNRLIPLDGDNLIEKETSGLLTLDPLLIQSVKSQLNGTSVSVQTVGQISSAVLHGLHVDCTTMDLYSGRYIEKYDETVDKADAVFVDSNNPGKVINSDVYATVVGNSVDPSKYGYIGAGNIYSDIDSVRKVIRGQFTPFVGLSKLSLPDWSDYINHNTRFWIQILQLSNRTESKNAIAIRANDNSEYYAISERTPISTTDLHLYRGDCYTTTQTIRVVRNFIDNNQPYTEAILKPESWIWNNIDPSNPNWDEINVGDLNTVSLGHWVTFKCLSNYNLGIRSNNPFDTNETSVMGNERSFYPLQASSATANKIEDSYLMNDGYNASTGRKRYEYQSNTPYIKSEFSNRVMFSNKNVTNAFINGYRVFQGLSYHDYDKQYGEIVKLLPWDSHLFCVFEHGLALLPVNEKALIQTTTNQPIHIYGHGVLPDTLTLISQDYGSKYPDSVIRTPIGIYGLDVDAKKIWRFSKNNGFETLSDMKIETWLKDNLQSYYEISIADLANVRTEYDSFKGDVIFNFSDGNSITFNERQNLWVTRNTWIPLLAENANGTMYSLNWGKDIESATQVGIYKHIYLNSETYPTQWYGQQHPFEFEFVVSDPVGVHKIINNLEIISNNCQPEALTFEIIGDSYLFNREKLRHLSRGRVDSDILNKTENNIPENDPTTNAIKNAQYVDYIKNRAKIKTFNGTTRGQDDIMLPEYDQDSRTKEFHLTVPQECKNIETYGRRLGNIFYKEDTWYTNVLPLCFDASLLTKDPGDLSQVIKEARIRDKWCKIRVRYTGEDLAVITAIKTMISI